MFQFWYLLAQFCADRIVCMMPLKPKNPEELVTAEGAALAGGERGENVPVKLAIVYVQFDASATFNVKTQLDPNGCVLEGDPSPRW
jgi:hypothetical protein